MHLDPAHFSDTKTLGNVSSRTDLMFKYGDDINQAQLSFPRLDSYSEIMARTAAIVDNLDEVMMLPQGFVFPIRNKRYRQMRGRVARPDGKEVAYSRKLHDQEEYYEEYHEYGY